MSDRITRDTLVELLKIEPQICLSLYMPAHRKFPQSSQDLIRYKNLVRKLRQRLSTQHPDTDQDKLMQPFEELAENHDTWIHQGDGLAVLSGENFFKVYRVQRPVPEQIVVNTHPYLKPLINIAQSAESYQVLCLCRDEVRLFEGNRDQLHEITPAHGVPLNQEQALGTQLTEKTQSGLPGGYSAAQHRGDPNMHEAGGSGKQDEIDRDRERFFREVDRAVLEYHSRPSRLPMILAALPENQAFFRAGTHNDQLVEEGVNIDPAALDVDTLRERCWEVMSHHFEAHLNDIKDQYGVSRGQGLASDQLEEIGPATISGRVATLLVEEGRTIYGKMDHGNGEVRLEGSEDDSLDLLDELALHGMQTGGNVLVLPADQMPTRSGAAAVFRF